MDESLTLSTLKCLLSNHDNCCHGNHGNHESKQRFAKNKIFGPGAIASKELHETLSLICLHLDVPNCAILGHFQFMVLLRIYWRLKVKFCTKVMTVWQVNWNISATMWYFKIGLMQPETAHVVITCGCWVFMCLLGGDGARATYAILIFRWKIAYWHGIPGL